MKRMQTICAAMLGLGLIAAAPRHPISRRAAASGPVLWHGIKTGMTEQQLTAAMPDAQKNGDGTYSVPDTVVDYSKMEVSVNMRDGRVWSVALTGGYPEALTKALTEKYGQPFNAYSCRAMMCGADWKAPGGVKVSLVTMTPAGVDLTRVTFAKSDVSGL